MNLREKDLDAKELEKDEYLKTKDAEIHSLTSKLADLVIRHETLVSKEKELQITLSQLKKSGKKLQGVQAMHRNARNKVGQCYERATGKEAREMRGRFHKTAAQCEE